MNKKFKFLIIVIFAVLHSLTIKPGNFEFSETSIISRLQEDIRYLASEELEGRESGTPSETITVNYIRDRLEETNIEPLFENTYFQHFEFQGEWVYTGNNTLQVNSDNYKAGKDYFPMLQSGNSSATHESVYAGYGLVNDDLEWDDYTKLENINGKIFIIEYYLPRKIRDNLNITTNEAIDLKIETALKHNPGGIIFVNTQDKCSTPHINLRRRNHKRKNIPIVFAGKEIYKQLAKQDFEVEITLDVELDRETLNGVNVAGYIDNEAPTTVVIGAHHDHLGYGGPTSRHKGEPAIHFGADDNASGVAGVLETARYISGNNLDQNNYIFITFSAEEKGLIGSSYFTKSDAYDMNKINYMFNFDMIGRMEDKKLTVIGTGSSPLWEKLIKESQPGHLDINMVASGVGRSDHTSFYLQNIPVLFFFTGIHEDYHNIGDTHEKVNYHGQKQILSLAWDLIGKINDKEKLEFSETRSNN